MNRGRSIGDSLCDFEIKVDGTTFRVHKTVLAEASDYFNAMFKTEMKEKYNLYVEINNFNVDTMNQVLSFIYTGNAKVVKENAFSLLSASHYFQLHRFTRIISSYLISSLNFDNFISVFLSATLLDSPILKEEAARLINKNILLLHKKDQFLSLKKDQVISVLNAIDQKASEYAPKGAFKAAVSWVKHDLKHRKCHFSEVIKPVELHRFSHEYLQKVFLREALLKSLNLEKILQDASCLASVTIKNKTCYNFAVLIQSQVRLFNSLTLKWQELPDFPGFRTGASVVTRHNIIYVMGGLTKEILMLDLDKEDAKWESSGELLEDRSNAKAIDHQSVILIYGGNTTQSCVMYNEEEVNRLKTNANDLQQQNTYHRTCLENLRFSYEKNDVPKTHPNFDSLQFRPVMQLISTVELYNPVTQSSYKIGSMRHGGNVSLMRHEGNVYVVGNNNVNIPGLVTGGFVEVYNNQDWNVVEKGLTFQTDAAVVCKGKIICVNKEGPVLNYSIKRNASELAKEHCCKYVECDALEMNGRVYLFGIAWVIGEAKQQFVLQRYDGGSEGWSVIHTEDCDMQACSITSL